MCALTCALGSLLCMSLILGGTDTDGTASITAIDGQTSALTDLLLDDERNDDIYGRNGRAEEARRRVLFALHAALGEEYAHLRPPIHGRPWITCLLAMSMRACSDALRPCERPRCG